MLKVIGASAVCAVLLLAGCSAPATPPNAAGQDSVKTVPAGPVDADGYSIGVGDTLDVYVWRHDDMSRTVPVRPDGKISTPLVEDLQAAGKTPSSLARDIEHILSEYIRNPKVTVIVTSFVGNSDDQIRVVGQASLPQAIPYRQNMTLLDVLIAVGGLTEFAAPRRSKIVRRSGGETQTIPVRPDLLLEKGDIRANVQMLPGDVLIIPEARF